ncbi:MAG: GDSL-type esterase/lipase family protein, partial [Acidobacteriota bacterium]
MKSKCILKMFSFLIILSCSLYSQTPKIRIACVGNSITQGFGPNDIRSYPQQLGQLLGGHYFVKNYGVGGRTLLRNGDYPYWNESAFLEAQDFKSDILIISLGTNDSKPQNWIYKNDFYSDYMNMIRQFRRDGRNPQIFVCFPTPVVKDNFGISNSVIHNEIIPLIDSVRKTSGTYLIDYYNNMPVVDSLYSDGVHPTEEGYKIMAQIAYMAIAKSPSGLI